MVVQRMQSRLLSFDVNRYSTPLLRQLQEKARKRTSMQAFTETAADALDELDLGPKAKRVVRRPPPLLTIYVRQETEKAYNAVFMEELTVESFKEAVSLRYGTPIKSVRKIEIQTNSGSIEKVDDNTIHGFDEEDTFTIVLNYNKVEGTCDILLSSVR
ncbi:predicted protein [Nematostella vectensis]|uniref:GRHL1/CP2 C-terminal domain-containing protein n=1 Tax=Nematostella vectensis TaxID=45351 RepID=A7RFN3_NEMVE|nr:predicted protein [Nematostella vectensis]|eukprot:XP_001641693.1 predicted protein [Nematostella vectensis]